MFHRRLEGAEAVAHLTSDGCATSHLGGGGVRTTGRHSDLSDRPELSSSRCTSSSIALHVARIEVKSGPSADGSIATWLDGTKLVKFVPLLTEVPIASPGPRVKPECRKRDA